MEVSDTLNLGSVNKTAEEGMDSEGTTSENVGSHH